MRMKAFRAAFPHTIPILAGFWFLGLTYGIYMNVKGFSFLYPMLMAMIIFGGSLEFVAADLLLGAFHPVQALLLALMIQARHLFYGIAMLDKYKNTGWKKFFLIYGMCDETFSINCTADIPADVDRPWFMLWVTWLDQLYWISGAGMGGIAGSFLKFNTKGLDFVMTAMFVEIFLNQWDKEKEHRTAIAGLGASVLCLAVFGKSDFMIPSMIVILVFLTLFRKTIEKKGGLSS